MNELAESVTAARAAGLTKRYRRFQLGPIDLELAEGTVTALIGRNGSGKSTTLGCLSGLVQPDEGVVEIGGRSVDRSRGAWKQRLGYVGEARSFYRAWTVRRQLDHVGGFYPGWSADRTAALLRRFVLPAEDRIDQLSRGNQTKLALLCALGHNPALLLLDEPFTGLDPVVRAETTDVLWELLRDSDTTILYSTHVLSDLARLADVLVFLVDGQIRLRATVDSLVEGWRRISFRSDSAMTSLGQARLEVTEGTMHRAVSADGDRTVDDLRAHGAEILDVTRMALDEIAIEILKKEQASCGDC